MQAALSDPKSPEALDRLAYLAHQLKGSGGSYGYQRISTDAAALEKALERLAGGGASGQSLEQEIEQHVGDLRAEIELRARELS